MCTRCRRNRAPGATLTSLNEGRDSPSPPPSYPSIVPRRSLFDLFPFYSSLSFLRGKKAVQKQGALNKQRKGGARAIKGTFFCLLDCLLATVLARARTTTSPPYRDCTGYRDDFLSLLFQWSVRRGWIERSWELSSSLDLAFSLSSV